MASMLINALTPHLDTAMRMGARRLGTPAAAAGQRFVEVAHAAREHVRTGGLFCELRANNRDESPAFVKNDGRTILHSELGQQDRKIMLQISTDRTLHDGTKSYEVGKTLLSDEAIIKIASFIFRRFARDYDMFIDNCQLFSVMLAENIGGKENAKEIRSKLGEKSVMKYPIAASWLVGPAYHLMTVVDHALPIVPLKYWEKFYYHPRIFDSREKTIQRIDSSFEEISSALLDTFSRK